MIDLTAAGLTETEAKCYQALIEKPEWKPAELATFVNETRTNCYKILDNLVAYGLAERFDKAKKLHYRASNPTHLLELSRKQREAHEQAEKQLELNAQELITQYIKVHEQPGVSYYQGKDALKAVFEDMLSANTPIYYVRSQADVKFFDEPFFDEFRIKRAQLGITTYGITPRTPHSLANKSQDTEMNFVRTMIPTKAYTAPVEWNVYGNKLAVISYGDDAIGMIIESPAIAESFRQLYQLASKASFESSSND